LKAKENLNQLKGWTNGGPLVKLVKREGRATRERARSPRRTTPGVTLTVMRMHCFVIHVSHNPLY
jgi:hypothetical protein